MHEFDPAPAMSAPSAQLQNSGVTAENATADRPLEAAPSRVGITWLAWTTGLVIVLSMLLARLVVGADGEHGGPAGIVAGQALWNAAQVGQLLLVLSVWLTERRVWTAIAGLVTIALLPFAIYVTSPGALALAALGVAICSFAIAFNPPPFAVTITSTNARSRPFRVKFELLALVCTLLCSMYNYAANRNLWPYWDSIFAGVAKIVGFTASPEQIARVLYTIGIAGVSFPDFILIGKPASNLGALVFLLIWTVLPALYVVYFAALAKMARYTPGTRLQQSLCLVGIVHFLFLTDLVDYRYGRGIENSYEIWAHYLEVFVWRIAILLPIYQKVAGGDLKRGTGFIGHAMHYGIAAFGLFFFVWEVLLLDVYRFAMWVVGHEFTMIRIFGRRPEALGYHGALVLMTLFYAFMVVAMPCKRLSLKPLRL